MKSKSVAGPVSLAVAIAGFSAMELALRQGWVAGSIWSIAAKSFEAATVGAVADWFAVTALFQEVRLPLIRRHTNILLKKKTQLIAGIADMVQNRWLSSEVIREHLRGWSASRFVLEYLGHEKHSEDALSLLRDLLREMVRGLDAPEVVSFLNRAIKDQVRMLDLAGPLGRWMGAVMRRGDHHAVWDTFVSAVERAVDGEEFRSTARRMVDRGIREYKDSGRHRELGMDVLEFLDVINRDEFVGVVLRKAKETVREARRNPSHPFRVRLDAAMLEFADGLAEGRPEAVSAFGKLRTALLEETDLKALLSGMLGRLRETVEEDLGRPDSDLGRLLRDVFRKRLRDFRGDPAVQEKVDAWVIRAGLELLDRHHAIIGDMVLANLKKLPDERLVSEIRESVGKDLQYIRLNGAIVGGLVGALLATARLLY